MEMRIPCVENFMALDLKEREKTLRKFRLAHNILQGGDLNTEADMLLQLVDGQSQLLINLKGLWWMMKRLHCGLHQRRKLENRRGVMT